MGNVFDIRLLSLNHPFAIFIWYPFALLPSVDRPFVLDPLAVLAGWLNFGLTNTNTNTKTQHKANYVM